ncbi:MAG: APC family permease [Prochloraceae cyanobacterium]
MRDFEVAEPSPTLSLLDAVAVIVGIIVGAGIFKTPTLVAANADSEMGFLLVWLVGGGISLVGALCYAELATAYPHAGGEYHYLRRAFGNKMALLFAWARLLVVQTGSIALLAFVFGDYAQQFLPGGEYASSIYAAAAIILLTALNSMGFQLRQWTQNLLSAAKLLGLLLVFIVGMVSSDTGATAVDANSSSSASYGLAMIFVLLTYGGWSEAAYISAELRNVRHNMTKALIASVCIITVIFFLVNLAYLKGLGLTEMASSEVVAADLMRRVLGEGGAQFISLLIAVSALGATHGTIFTGARTNYALGQDFELFGFLGRWELNTNAPTNALLVQGIIALAEVLLGTITRTGFATIVEYTAPVFWFFLLFTGVSLFVLRVKEPSHQRPFCVPFYPFTPLLFCGTCLYMLRSSLIYTGVGALVGIIVLLTGVPLLLLVGR